MWLALLMPLAQAAAAWHGASHGLSEAASPDDGRKAAHAAEHCELCLMAASLGGSAPAADAPTLLPQAGEQRAPVHAQTSAWIAPTLTAYSSRAPPRTPS